MTVESVPLFSAHQCPFSCPLSALSRFTPADEAACRAVKLPAR